MHFLMFTCQLRDECVFQGLFNSYQHHFISCKISWFTWFSIHKLDIVFNLMIRRWHLIKILRYTCNVLQDEMNKISLCIAVFVSNSVSPDLYTRVFSFNIRFEWHPRALISIPLFLTFFPFANERFSLMDENYFRKL